MITLTVTSDSSLPELHVAERTVADLIKLAIGRDMEYDTLKANLSNARNDLHSAIIEAVEDLYVNGTSDRQPVGIFNKTELAEAEELGKPLCSTADAEASQTAHADTTVNTSIPTPQSVFGQPAQTVENAANPVAPATDSPVKDANGMVWDERIHSSSREMNKDGTWRKRRGVSDELVKQVEAELRNAPLGFITSVSNDTVTVAIPTELGMQEIPAPTSGSMTFSELLDAVTKAMVAGQVTQAKINEALQSIGVAALPHLIVRADLIPAFREALGGVV